MSIVMQKQQQKNPLMLQKDVFRNLQNGMTRSEIKKEDFKDSSR